MMEWPSGHVESSGPRAFRKKINNFAPRPDCNPEPRTVGENALTVLGLQAHSGARILRSHRSNVHSNMPPGYEGFGLPSGSHARIGENHEDGLREPLLESDHLENQNKMKKLKQKLDSVIQPPSESHSKSDKNHEDGLREPFIESSCLVNQKKMTKLKHKLDSITQPLHTKTAWHIASGSRPVTRRSSSVAHGCAPWLEQKSRTNRGGKRPHREEGHTKGSGVLMNSKSTTSSDSSGSSLQCIPIGVPYMHVQSPFTSSPSSSKSQHICSIPQTTIPPSFPSESHVKSEEDHEDRWGEPFTESGSLRNKSKLKRLKYKQDSITQPLCTDSALQIAVESRSVRKRSSDAINDGYAPQEQKSGTDHGGKRLCKEEGYDEDSSVAPMNSEHTTSSVSVDSSLQLSPDIFPYTCVQNPRTSPQSQPILSTPQPTIPPMLPPPNHHQEDIPSGSSSRRLTSAACNKPLIFPDCSGFYPNPTEVVHCISSIIQQKFDGPWPIWKKIPMNVRDQWFEEFQKRYDWQPELARQVRSNFEARGRTRLRNFFCMARKNLNVRPHWLRSEVWESLKQYWDSPEFKLQSEQAKINRASDCDGLGPSKHTCGSIPMSEHKRRLEEKTGEEVTPMKLFVHTHQRKDKTWIDTKSSQAYEYMKELNKLDSSQPATQLSGTKGEGQTSAQPIQPCNPELAETELFIKTNLTKRGGIYGLASEAVKYKSSGSSSYNTSKGMDITTPNWFDSPEFQQYMRDKVTEINSEWNTRFEQERRDTQELRKRVAELEREKLDKMKKKKAKKKLNKMKEMMETLQKQYDSLSKGHPDSDDDDDDDDNGSTDSGY